MKSCFRSITSIVCVAVFVSTVAAEPVSTPGRIAAVTVYRGQARVTRTIDVKLPAGPSEVIVTSLPPAIITQSLYATAGEGVRVLSVRYREQAVEADTRQEAKTLDAKIEETNLKLLQLDLTRKITDELYQKYLGLWQLAVDATNVDLNRSVLDFTSIEKITKYADSSMRAVHNENLASDAKRCELVASLELLKRQREELGRNRSRNQREAVLYMDCKQEGKATITLAYLVDQASWCPQYNLRADAASSQVTIEYNAVINQTSGEGWDGVDLSLSTAQPTMVAASAELKPLKVALSASRPASASVPGQQGAALQVPGQADVLTLNASRRQQVKNGKAAEAELNMYATENQNFIFNADASQIRQMQQQLKEVERIEGLTVTYHLPGRLSTPSRSDQQLVTIAIVSAKADFAFVANPLLTDYVYLQADVHNSSDTVFLPGQASMFRNNEFVGRGDMPAVSTGATFTAGFGVESSIQVTQELENKTTRTQGGNSIDTYDYRITLRNYGNAAVGLRLLDRIPLASDTSIKIDLVSATPELSTDAEYKRTSRKKGLLRWDINLKPDSENGDSTVVRYTYTCEYDRNMAIQAQ